jgi:hypothetical protein
VKTARMSQGSGLVGGDSFYREVKVECIISALFLSGNHRGYHLSISDAPHP